MKKKVIDILMYMGCAIVLVLLLYKYSEKIDGQSPGMMETEKNTASDQNDLNKNEFTPTYPQETLQSGQSPEESEMPEAVSENDTILHWMPYCEFEEIEANHEILEYDISTSPRYDYENTLLRDYIEKEKEENDEFVNTFGSRYEMWIDYHLFDFNGDGIEDYLLCIDGILWSGSAGHLTEIFIVKEDGTIERVLSINLRFHHYKSPEHERFTVLNEKSDGFYAIVLPGTNRILRYDKNEGKYVFQEGE